MSLHTKFKNLEELTEHLKNIDYPQCFTVNYLPETEEYEMWIGNQPYYNYEKLIESKEEDIKKLVNRIKQLNTDKEDMYQLATRADWVKEDFNIFERIFSK